MPGIIAEDSSDTMEQHAATASRTMWTLLADDRNK